MSNERLAYAGKAPMTDAERQAKRRQKLKLNQEAGISKSLFDEAKEYIKEMADPHMDQMLSLQKFSEGLSSEEMKQLTTFTKNWKQKVKQEKKVADQSKITELTIKEKVKKIANQEFAELQKSLTIPHSQKERQDLILSKVDENLFLFLDYMEQHEPPYSDFLKDIVEAHGKVRDEVFTKLFANVCSLYGGQELVVTSGMCEAAMMHLTNGLPNIQAAFGLLRLIFQNDISLNGYSKDLLLSFQLRYEQTIASFLKTVTKVKRTVIELLPPTIFTFSPPLLKCLREGADELHRQVPLDFLPMLIDIISYSFNKDFNGFQMFLQVFKDGCMKHIEYLRETEFQNLLQAVSEQVQKRSKIYFGNLETATETIKKAFTLVAEGKILRFDDEVVSSLVEGGTTAFQIFKQQPKIISREGSKGIQQLMSQIEKQNISFTFKQQTFQIELSEQELAPFRALKIHHLLEIQHLAYCYCIQLEKNSKTLIQYSTGQGKTALCFATVCQFAKKGLKVLILNSCQDLTFRDFKNALELSHLLGRNVVLLDKQPQVGITQSNIHYASFSIFAQLGIKYIAEQLQDVCLIVDEFDSIIFSEGDNQHLVRELIRRAHVLIGFTGSDLQNYHKTFVEQTLNIKILNFILGKDINPNVHLTDCTIYGAIREYRTSITNKALEQCQKTPVIIIMEEGGDLIQASLQKKGVVAINLANQQSDYVEASLRVFAEKQNEYFSIYIISEGQGRGLDFPSNKEIEQNGGVFLLISCLPKKYLQYQQFIGRTGRIGNKGAYCICLLDRDAKNVDGQSYLSQKLEQLKNQDILNLQGLLALQNQGAQEKLMQIQIQGVSQENIEEHQGEPQIEKTVSEAASDYIHSEQSLQDPETLPIHQIIAPIAIEESKGLYEGNLKALASLNQRRQEKFDQKASVRTSKRLNKENQLKWEIDRLYFEGYSHPAIHDEMLSDFERHKAYETAIQKLCRDQVVVDVGAGSGFLSVLAANSGAQHVYGIENSEYFVIAQKNIKAKQLDSKITLIKGMAEEVELPVEKVDVIVSEWMGYLLICENMLSSVIEVRKKYLKPGGQIIPRSGSIFIATYKNLPEDSAEKIQQINTDPTTEAIVGICIENQISSNISNIFKMDFLTEELQGNAFESPFQLTLSQAGTIDGFVCWFDVDMGEGITLTTSPYAPVTHWQHLLFPIDLQEIYREGDSLTGVLKVFPQPQNYRALNAELTINSGDGISMQRFIYTIN